MKKAQGTIEYLVILAVIVVVALVVVSLMLSSTAPASSITETQSKLYWKTQPISITDVVADSNGNMILIVSPKETITISKIEINGQDEEIETNKIFAGNEQPIFIQGTALCNETGAYDIKIYYSTESGLEKVQSGESPIIITCDAIISAENISSEDYLSNNLVTNGAFDDETGWDIGNPLFPWVLDTNAYYSYAWISGGPNYGEDWALEQDIGAQPGHTYRLTFDLTTKQGCIGLMPHIGGTNGTKIGDSYTNCWVNGIQTQDITATTSGNLKFYLPSGGGSFYIDNLTIIDLGTE